MRTTRTLSRSSSHDPTQVPEGTIQGAEGQRHQEVHQKATQGYRDEFIYYGTLIKSDLVVNNALVER